MKMMETCYLLTEVACLTHDNIGIYGKEWFERLWENPTRCEPDQASVVKRVEDIWVMVQPRTGDTVLDVACGTGSETIEIAARGVKVTGLDQSVVMLDIGKNRAVERGIEVEWICADMRTIDYHDMFDVVMLRDVIFGIFDHDTNVDILSRLARAVKPEGRLFLEVYNKSAAIKKGIIEGILRYNPSTSRFEGSIELQSMTCNDGSIGISSELLTIEEWRSTLTSLGLVDLSFLPASEELPLDSSLVVYITGRKSDSTIKVTETC